MHTDTKAYGLLITFIIIGSFFSGLLCYHYIIPYFSTEEQTPEIHNHYYLNETNVYFNESIVQNQNITQFLALEFNITVAFTIRSNGTSIFLLSFKTVDSIAIMKYNVVKAFSEYSPPNATLIIYTFGLNITDPYDYNKNIFNVSDCMLEEFTFVNQAVMLIFTFYDIVFYETEFPISCNVLLRII